MSQAMERMVLGQLLVDPGLVIQVAPLLHPEHFWLDKHKRLYELLLEVQAAGMTPDPVYVLERIIGGGHEDDFGGAAYVAALGDHVPSTANVLQNVALLKGGFLKRKVNAQARELAQASANGHDPEDVVAMAQALGADAAKEAEWPAPVPVAEWLPPFPMQLLPAWVGDFASAVAEFTQVPPDVAGMTALGMMAVALRGRTSLEVRDGYRELLTLYVVTAAGAGELKSPAFRALRKPVDAFEKDERERLAAEIRYATVERKALERRVGDLEKRLAKNPTDPITQAQLKEATKELESKAVPKAPSILLDDVTPEEVAHHLFDQGYGAIVADEGGFFENAAGLYSKGVPKIDVFNHGHDGSPVRVNRRVGQSFTVAAAKLGLVMAVQPRIVEQLADKDGFRDRGLLGRFLYAIPRSRVGYRNARPATVSRSLWDGYSRRMREMLVAESLQPVIRLEDQAVDYFLDQKAALELRLRPGEDLAHLPDWANKLHGRIARIAGILHMHEHPTDPYVQLETMKRAWGFGEYLCSHALRAFGMMAVSTTVEDRISKWLATRKSGGPITAREAYRALRCEVPTDRVQRALDHLVELGQVRRLPMLRSGGIAGRSIRYAVNPRLREQAGEAGIH